MFNIANNTEFLEALGINDAPEETKAKLIAGLEDLAKERITIKLSECFSEEQAKEFGAITDEQQAYDWIMKNIPDFEQMIADVLSDIKFDILRQKAEVVG